MITIACVLRSGGDFDKDHVRRLVNSIKSNLSVRHRIDCLTDYPPVYRPELLRGSWSEDDKWPPLGCSTGQLRYDWPGWWSKIELFALPPPVLYFDLDTQIIGNIDPLANWVSESCEGLMMLRGFYQDDRCSGIMGWRQDMSWVLDRFRNHYADRAKFIRRPSGIAMQVNRNRYRGDQEWLAAVTQKESTPVTFVQDVFPGIYSYKVHVKDNGVPDDARIICFHGKPRPHEVTL